VNALSLQRQEVVSESLCDIRNVINKQGVALAALQRVKEFLLSLASRGHSYLDQPVPAIPENTLTSIANNDPRI